MKKKSEVVEKTFGSALGRNQAGLVARADLGQMDKACAHCGALFFEFEAHITRGRGGVLKFGTQCCGNGRIEFDHVPEPEEPSRMRDVYVRPNVNEVFWCVPCVLYHTVLLESFGLSTRIRRLILNWRASAQPCATVVARVCTVSRAVFSRVIMHTRSRLWLRTAGWASASSNSTIEFEWTGR